MRDEPLAVWLHYCTVMKPRLKGDPSDALDADTRRIIRDALKVAGTIDEDAVAFCNRAIDGCERSDFHMGREAPHRYTGGRKRKYNTIGHIFKGRTRKGETTRDRLLYFVGIAESAPQVASGDAARVQQAKRDVLDAHEFPGDELVVERGGDAVKWLTENGWVVEFGDDGRPTFRVAS